LFFTKPVLFFLLLFYFIRECGYYFHICIFEDQTGDMSIQENLKKVKNTFRNTDCLLVAVSKSKPIEDIMEAYQAGIRDFGENKVQELTDKQPQLPSDIRWHMIGHLQRNKVKYIAPFVHLIHGVDSFKLLKAINKEAKKADRTLSCLLQIHIAKEESKYGFDEKELLEMLDSEEIRHLEHIRVMGLMGMATNTTDEQTIRTEFAGLKEFRERLKQRPLPSNFDLEEISMGMSGDYLLAQEEGSTIVRIGSAIFGSRNEKG
jgi:pyridoxal phosphate enzyme (YggS family)